MTDFPRVSADERTMTASAGFFLQLFKKVSPFSVLVELAVNHLQVVAVSQNTAGGGLDRSQDSQNGLVFQIRWNLGKGVISLSADLEDNFFTSVGRFRSGYFPRPTGIDFHQGLVEMVVIYVLIVIKPFDERRFDWQDEVSDLAYLKNIIRLGVKRRADLFCDLAAELVFGSLLEILAGAGAGDLSLPF
jgi:hypothetical protein